jgi:uncharacterized protein YqgC (DUF456 family)
LEPLVVGLTLLVMLAGMVGVVVPVMPGLLLVWVAGVGTLLWQGTDVVGWTVAGVLTALFLVGSGATLWLPTRQGRRGGVPGRSLGVALLGALVGFFLVPVLGLVLGAFAGLLYAEHRRLGDWPRARASVGQVLRAYGIGVLVELVVGVVMIATWLVTVLARG